MEKHTKEKVETIHYLAELLGGYIAHGETEHIPSVERALEEKLEELRETDPSWHRSAMTDAVSITIWHSQHLQDVMLDKGVKLEPCRVCEMKQLSREKRDAITSARGHTQEEVDWLCAV